MILILNVEIANNKFLTKSCIELYFTCKNS